MGNEIEFIISGHSAIISTIVIKMANYKACIYFSKMKSQLMHKTACSGATAEQEEEGTALPAL